MDASTADAKARLTDAVGREIVATVMLETTLKGLDSDKNAAVLVPLFDSNGSIRVLLTKRSQFVSSHKGEICFPGGRVEASDRDDVDTALRETEEEIGLAREHVEIVTHLPSILSRNLVCVRPIVGIIPRDARLSVDPREVESAFSMPLAEFLNARIARSRTILWRGQRVLMPFFDYRDSETNQVHTVYGLTGWICLAVAVCVYRKMPEFDLDPPGENEIRQRLKSLLASSQL
ncbi:uncharacterized protein [Oscarella lobularis]|uniref:uncharacterized protein n=1 Tax=Oscarella lobularis TaxID=121494 RepID=UPI0033143F54